MKLSRRDFIKQTAMCAALGLMPRMVWAQSAGGSGNNLVFINLKGGADGLSLCPYYEGIAYQTLLTRRPTIKINPASIIKPFAQNGSSSKVGLHPSFNLLSQAAGTNCAIFQKYGLTQDPGRSHDTCQLLYSVGANGGGNTNQQGFLARIMDQEKWESFQVWGIQAENGPEFDTTLNPPMLVSSLDSLDASLTYAENGNDQQLVSDIVNRLAASEASTERLKALYQNTNKTLKDTLKSVKADILSQAVGSNLYGNYTNSAIGSSLKDTARILISKSHNTGVLKSALSTVVYLNNDGYDTHSDQANPDSDNLSTNLTSLGDNLAVFIQDMKSAGIWNKTTIILFSEFGRTIHENGSPGDLTVGTDHGWGSNTVILGGSVQGGVYGDAPTNNELTDDETNALVPTTDYRDIFSEALEWISVDPLQIFNLPDYRRSRLGLFL